MSAKRKLPLLCAAILLGLALLIALFLFLSHGRNGDLPESDIATAWTEDAIVPYSIQVVESSDGLTPAFELANGDMVIFTKPDGGGWSLEENETLSWRFAEQPLAFHQTLSVGYIRDNTVYGASSYYLESEGTFTVQADAAGVYYIYCLGTSSDPIALKEGEIKVTE